jgi:hypothetical protein
MGSQQFQDQLWWQPGPSKGLGPTWFFFPPTSKPKSNQLLIIELEAEGLAKQAQHLW